MLPVSLSCFVILGKLLSLFVLLSVMGLEMGSQILVFDRELDMVHNSKKTVMKAYLK